MVKKQEKWHAFSDVSGVSLIEKSYLVFYFFNVLGCLCLVRGWNLSVPPSMPMEKRLHNADRKSWYQFMKLKLSHLSAWKSVSSMKF